MKRVCTSVEDEFREATLSTYHQIALPTERIVCDKHVLGFHRGVGLRMSFVRQKHWVPRLRQLTQKESYQRLWVQ